MTDTRQRRRAKDALFEGFAMIARALASGRRVEIIEVLGQGERTVEHVAEAIDQSVANTSHHLRTLARAGLVTTRREGTHIHYRLASEQVSQMWRALRDLAAGHLETIADLTRAYLGDRGGLESITAKELRDRLEEDTVVLLDVRPEVEYEAGHLPGSVSLPPDRLDSLDEILPGLPSDRVIVAYCRGPYCVYADDAIRELARHGRMAFRLEEGVPEWRQGGGAVET